MISGFNIIDEREVDFLNQTSCDKTGRVFFYENKLYRAIANSSAENIKEVFSCGLIDELIKKRLFPESIVTNLRLQNYELVVSHQYIAYLAYPHEWTYDMLKTAAVTTLMIKEICNKYGFDLSDAHPENIVFDGIYPIFVDLGSFVKQKQKENWGAAERFQQSFVYPLKIWAGGNEFIARRMMVGYEYIPHSSYFLYKCPFLRKFNVKKMSLAIDLWQKYKKISTLTQEQLSISGYLRKMPRVLAKSIQLCHKYNLFPFQKFKTSSVVNKISALQRRGYGTKWAEYHTGVKKEVVSIEKYPRFDKIIQILKGLDCSSVTELGANQGELAMLILKKTNIKRVACIDIDEGAMDIGFCIHKKGNLNISHAVIDFLHPMNTEPKKAPDERFKSDVVIALALTHHLTLGQGNEIQQVFSKMAAYTTKYIFVEFMPFGFDMTFQGIGLPAWYSENWFKNAFEDHFKLLNRIILEPNRVLFIGIKKECIDSA